MAQLEVKAAATLDSSQFSAGLSRIKGQTQGFSQSLGQLKGLVAGAFGVGAVIAFGRRVMTAADDLQTAAQTIGVTTQTMLGLQAAMAESGIKSEDMLRIMGRIPMSQGEVVKGTKTMTDALKALNITEEEFVGLKPDEALARLAKAYAASGKSSEAFNAIGAIFGMRIGPAMIEVLDRINRDGLAKYTEGMEAAAKGMDQLAAANNNIELVWNSIITGAGTAVGKIMELGEALGAVSTSVERMSGFRKLMMILNPAIGVVELARMMGEQSGAGVPGSLGNSVQGATPSAVDQSKAADLAALQDRKAAEAKKAADAAAKAWLAYYDKIDAAAEKEYQDDVARARKRLDIEERYQEAGEAFAERKAGLERGEGVSAGAESRVDALQRVGGLIGGVAGAGDAAARRAERQEKIQEAIKKAADDHNRKLDELVKTAKELNEE